MMTGRGLAKRESGGTCSMNQSPFKGTVLMGSGFTRNSKHRENTQEDGVFNTLSRLGAWKG